MFKDYGYISVFDLEEIPTGETKKEEYKMMHEEELLNLDIKEYPEIDTIIVYSENGGYKKIKEVSNVIVEGNKVYYETPDDYDLSITVSDFELSGNEMKVEVSEEDSKKAEVNINKIAAEIRLAAGLDNPIKETKKGGNNEMKLTRIETTPKVVETPKVETPKVETPKVETPKVAKTPKMEFFEVEANSPATIKGIKYKGRIGIDISDFSFKICTASNQAVYKHVRVFRGENDPWKYWGKFRGVFKEPVNGRREAEFEFFAIGSRILVSYWKSDLYVKIARKLAAQAINKLNKVLK